MLRTHYRQPMDWTVRGLEESYNTLHSLTDWPEFAKGEDQSFDGSVLEPLCDDLNTPLAIAGLHGLYRQGNFAALGPTLRALGLRAPKSTRKVDEQKVVSLLDARNAARQAKNFQESDRIRDELKAMGVVIKDSKDGTTWEIAR